MTQIGPFMISTNIPTTTNTDCPGTNSTRQTVYLSAYIKPPGTAAPGVGNVIPHPVDSGVCYVIPYPYYYNNYKDTRFQFYLEYNNPTDTHCSILLLVDNITYYVVAPTFTGELLLSLENPRDNGNTWSLGITANDGKSVFYLKSDTISKTSTTDGCFVHYNGNENQWWFNYNKFPNIAGYIYVDNISSNNNSTPLLTNNGKSVCNYSFSFIPNFIPVSNVQGYNFVPENNKILEGETNLDVVGTSNKKINGRVMAQKNNLFNKDTNMVIMLYKNNIIIDFNEFNCVMKENKVLCTKNKKVGVVKGEKIPTEQGFDVSYKVTITNNDKLIKHNEILSLKCLSKHYTLLKHSQNYVIITDKIGVSFDKIKKLIKYVKINYNVTLV